MPQNFIEMSEEDSFKLMPEVNENTCGTVCYHPECACRFRLIAGCSLPLVIAQTNEQKLPNHYGEGEKNEK